MIFASETLGSVVMEDIGERDWVLWVLFDGIDYPETVTDMIGDLQIKVNRQEESFTEFSHLTEQHDNKTAEAV